MPAPADLVLCLYRTCLEPAAFRIAAGYCRPWHGCADHAPAMIEALSIGGDRTTSVSRVNLDPRRCEECGSPESVCLERQARAVAGTHPYVPHVPRRVGAGE